MAPGHLHTYNWTVPARAGPGPADPSSIVWWVPLLAAGRVGDASRSLLMIKGTSAACAARRLYHSHLHEGSDPYAGLFGPIIISRAESADEAGAPNDVDRELVLTFQASSAAPSILHGLSRTAHACFLCQTGVPGVLRGQPCT